MRMEVDEPASKVVAAIDDAGTIIGLATAGVTRGEDAQTPWELYSINVVTEQQGTGLADDLIRITAGNRDTTVWVLIENKRAQSFYKRHSFRHEGVTTVDEVSGACEIRMVRRSVAR
jgi:ribosomal protein S18 acetylase RimI-like enzyme